MGKSSIFESLSPYEVLWRIHNGEPVELSDLTEMEDEGYIIREGDDFKVSVEKLEDEWMDIWGKEVEGEIRMPTNFKGFLESYIDSYLEKEKNSTITRMLKDDFLNGLKVKEDRTGLPNSLKELRKQLEENFARNHYTYIHVKNGIHGSGQG